MNTHSRKKMHAHLLKISLEDEQIDMKTFLFYFNHISMEKCFSSKFYLG